MLKWILQKLSNLSIMLKINLLQTCALTYFLSLDFFYTRENIRKSEFFKRFQGVYKERGGTKWVKKRFLEYLFWKFRKNHKKTTAMEPYSLNFMDRCRNSTAKEFSILRIFQIDFGNKVLYITGF